MNGGIGGLQAANLIGRAIGRVVVDEEDGLAAGGLANAAHQSSNVVVLVVGGDDEHQAESLSAVVRSLSRVPDYGSGAVSNPSAGRARLQACRKHNDGTGALAPVTTAKAALDGPWFRRTKARLFHRYKFQTDPLPRLPCSFRGLESCFLRGLFSVNGRHSPPHSANLAAKHGFIAGAASSALRHRPLRS